jgi:Na+-driven multidrug efflux pump
MVSTGSLLRLSASAAVMNAIVPLAVMAQLAMLGRRATALQASFGLVVTATSFGSVVFNFLVDGVTAKVGKSVGAGRYREAAGEVKMAFLAAAVCGGVAAATLLALRDPLFSLFRATPEIARHARPYFFVRSAAAPAQCAANAASGCLGGYGRVHAATALSVGRALLEAAAVATAVALAKTDKECFAWIGFAYAACAFANAAFGVALVVALPPKGSANRVPVLASFSRRVSLSASFDEADDGAAERRRREGDELPTSSPSVGDDDENENENSPSSLPFLSFLADGASMFARSFLLQGTFFGAMVVASRELGPAGLAAHNVVCQLWMLSSYVVDGFATAGTVCGARLVGEAAGKKNAADDERNENESSLRSLPTSFDGSHSGISPETPVLPRLRSVCHRVLAFGLAAGACFLALFFLAEARLVALFTSDEHVAAYLRERSAWRTLALAQPLNALVFVYDGLVYAFQDFAYARELMSTGVGYVFLPSLIYVTVARDTTLADVWRCKVALNAWRLALLAARTHGWSLTAGGFECQVRKNENRTVARRLSAKKKETNGATRRESGGGDERAEGRADDYVALPERRAAPARAAGASRDSAEAVGVESPTSHWRQLGSAAREDGDGSGDDVEAPLLSRGSPR